MGGVSKDLREQGRIWMCEKQRGYRGGERVFVCCRSCAEVPFDILVID